MEWWPLQRRCAAGVGAAWLTRPPNEGWRFVGAEVDAARLKKGTGTSPGALLGGVIDHELGASPLSESLSRKRHVEKGYRHLAGGASRWRDRP